MAATFLILKQLKGAFSLTLTVVILLIYARQTKVRSFKKLLGSNAATKREQTKPYR